MFKIFALIALWMRIKLLSMSEHAFADILNSNTNQKRMKSYFLLIICARQTKCVRQNFTRNVKKCIQSKLRNAVQAKLRTGKSNESQAWEFERKGCKNNFQSLNKCTYRARTLISLFTHFRAFLFITRTTSTFKRILRTDTTLILAFNIYLLN